MKCLSRNGHSLLIVSVHFLNCWRVFLCWGLVSTFRAPVGIRCSKRFSNHINDIPTQCVLNWEGFPLPYSIPWESFKKILFLSSQENKMHFLEWNEKEFLHFAVTSCISFSFLFMPTESCKWWCHPFLFCWLWPYLAMSWTSYTLMLYTSRQAYSCALMFWSR